MLRLVYKLYIDSELNIYPLSVHYVIASVRQTYPSISGEISLGNAFEVAAVDQPLRVPL